MVNFCGIRTRDKRQLVLCFSATAIFFSARSSCRVNTIDEQSLVVITVRRNVYDRQKVVPLTIRLSSIVLALRSASDSVSIPKDCTFFICHFRFRRFRLIFNRPSRRQSLHHSSLVRAVNYPKNLLTTPYGLLAKRQYGFASVTRTNSSAF